MNVRRWTSWCKTDEEEKDDTVPGTPFPENIDRGIRVHTGYCTVLIPPLRYGFGRFLPIRTPAFQISLQAWNGETAQELRV